MALHYRNNNNNNKTHLDAKKKEKKKTKKESANKPATKKKKNTAYIFTYIYISWQKRKKRGKVNTFRNQRRMKKWPSLCRANW